MPQGYEPGAVDPETGLYQDPGALSSPGPGGVGSGIISGLAMMNAARSAALATRSEALRHQKDLMDVFNAQAASGGNFYSGDTGQQVLDQLGVTPEEAANLYASSPQGRVQKGIRDWMTANPGKQPAPADLEQIYLSNGIPMPTGFYGYAGRSEATHERLTAAQMRAFSQARDAALKEKKRISDAGYPEDKAVEGALNVARASAGPIPPEYLEPMIENLERELRSTPATVAPKVAADIGEKKARGAQEQAHADWYKKLMGPESEVLAARAHLEEARAKAIAALGVGSGGKLTAGQQITAESRALTAEATAGKYEIAAKQAGNEAIAPALLAEAARYREGAKRIRELGTPKPAAAGAPAGGTPSGTPAATAPKKKYTAGKPLWSDKTQKWYMPDQNGVPQLMSPQPPPPNASGQ